MICFLHHFLLVSCDIDVSMHPGIRMSRYHACPICVPHLEACHYKPLNLVYEVHMRYLLVTTLNNKPIFRQASRGIVPSIVHAQ